MEGTPLYQLGREGHRGTAAVKRLVEHAPATGGLALWMQHRDVDLLPVRLAAADPTRAAPARNGPAAVCANDGHTVFYLASFERLPLERQTGEVAHQVLHVAFRHVARREALAGRIGQLDARLWNVAADALINACLSHLDWLELPTDAVRLDALLAEALGLRAPVAASLLRWDVESLYRELDDRRRGSGRADRTGRSGGNGDADDGTAGDGAGSASDSLDRDGPPATPSPDAPAFENGPRASIARRLGAATAPDLLDGDVSSAPQRDATQARDWHERLGRAHAADGSRSLLRELGADRQASRTPWEQLLRRRLARSLSPEPELSWSRPTRGWIANRGRTASGHRLPWEPGTLGTRAAPRLAVIVDVSGSVDDAQLRRFGGEIDRIVKRHRGEAWLIVGDDRVRAEHRLRAGCRPLRELVLEGGEGTDFRPLIQASMRHRPDLIVALTDLAGPAGDAPSVEVLWVTPVDADAATPYGSRLRLD